MKTDHGILHNAKPGDKMRICPYKNIELLSPLTKPEVYEKFRYNIAYVNRLKITGMSRDAFRDYEGYIDEDKIVFRRILKRGANSFIPKVTAVVSETGGGTKVQLKARLHKVIEGMIIGLNSFLLCLFLIGLINMDLSTKPGFDILFLSGLIVMFVILNGVMIRILFSYEVYKLEKDFRRILMCDEKSPGHDKRLNNIIEKIAQYVS